MLINDPGHSLQAPLGAERLIWTVAPGFDATFEGQAFGDGSGYHGSSVVTRRCGFAVAGSVALYANDAVAEEGIVGARVLVCGALPGPAQEVPLAELYALYVALRFAMPNSSGCFEFFTDCLWIISSFRKGEQHCTSAGCWGAAMWKKVFALVRSLLGENDGASKLILTKVKAHSSLVSCGGQQFYTSDIQGQEQAVKNKALFDAIGHGTRKEQEGLHESPITPLTNSSSS